MGTLARAIEAENWELAAYVLAISVLRVAEAVPPETLSALLELLEGSDGTERVRRRAARRSTGRR